MLSIVYLAIPTDIQEGTINYDFVDDLNTSGFSSSEIDSDTGGFWGFFSGIAGVAVAALRFFGFVLFGIGLPAATPFWFLAFFFWAGWML